MKMLIIKENMKDKLKGAFCFAIKVIFFSFVILSVYPRYFNPALHIKTGSCMQNQNKNEKIVTFYCRVITVLQWVQSINDC